MSNWKPILSVVVLIVLASQASAKSPIYRCIKDGQTVLTDTPCDASTAASSSEPAGIQAAAPESIVGQWRGQTQFQGAEDGRELQEVHSVVPLVLTFSADGKVSGVVPVVGPLVSRCDATTIYAGRHLERLSLRRTQSTVLGYRRSWADGWVGAVGAASGHDASSFAAEGGGTTSRRRCGDEKSAAA